MIRIDRIIRIDIRAVHILHKSSRGRGGGGGVRQFPIFADMGEGGGGEAKTYLYFLVEGRGEGWD